MESRGRAGEAHPSLSTLGPPHLQATESEAMPEQLLPLGPQDGSWEPEFSGPESTITDTHRLQLAGEGGTEREGNRNSTNL